MGVPGSTRVSISFCSLVVVGAKLAKISPFLLIVEVTNGLKLDTKRRPTCQMGMRLGRVVKLHLEEIAHNRVESRGVSHSEI